MQSWLGCPHWGDTWGSYVLRLVKRGSSQGGFWAPWGSNAVIVGNIQQVADRQG